MKFLTLLISCVLLFNACQSAQNIGLNKWANTPIKVDGQLDDWQKPLQKPIRYTEIECEVANDSNTLYICTRISDQLLQKRIMTLGMTIWIDTLVKNREKLGINYPIALNEAQIQSLTFAAQQNTTLGKNPLQEAYAKICQEFELVGFVEERVRVSNLASRDMKVATSFDELGAMVCELKIPLHQLWDNPTLLNKKFSVGIKINPPPPNIDDEPGLFDDPNRNRITGGNQNTLGTNMPGQSPNARRPMTRINSSNDIGIWIKTTLIPKKP